MANTDLMSFRLIDAAGRVGQAHIYFPAGATLAQLQAYADLVALDIDAITGAVIDAITVTKSLTKVAGLKANAAANSEVPVGANMAYDAANTPYRHTIRIPALLDTMKSGDAVNDQQQAVIDFNTQITVGDGVIAPSDRYGNDLTDFLEGVVTFRKA